MTSTPDRRTSPAQLSGLPTQRPVARLVPAPLHHAALPGAPFPLGAHLRVVGTDADDAAAVARHLARLLGRPVPSVDHDDGTPGVVAVQTGAPWRADDGQGSPPAGAYRLTIGADRVALRAADATGLAHAATTLALLAEDGAVRPAVVVDSPRFAWRGFSLDVARHFHDVATVVRVLDVMAELKLNVLHLHLTDDQGWRLEIPSRPRLTEVSGRTAVGGDPGGWFTTDDFATVQARAAERGITVVPEIDVPGHVNAALHAYGELTPSGEPAEAYAGTDVGFSQLRADLPATEAFLRDVLADVAAMTVGPYVHIGGDEPLSMDPVEYRRLVELAAGIVAEAGKTPVGWQEVSRARLAPGTVVQYWDERADADADTVARAARDGARVLLSPATRAYLEMRYDDDTPPGIGLEWAGHIELRDAYGWDPLEVLPAVPASAIVGLEAAVWSETVRTADDLFTLLLPRLAAFAEVAWSAPDRREWSSFATRVRRLAPRWTAAGLAWHRSAQVDW